MNIHFGPISTGLTLGWHICPILDSSSFSYLPDTMGSKNYEIPRGTNSVENVMIVCQKKQKKQLLGGIRLWGPQQYLISSVYKDVQLEWVPREPSFSIVKMNLLIALILTPSFRLKNYLSLDYVWYQSPEVLGTLKQLVGPNFPSHV